MQPDRRHTIAVLRAITEQYVTKRVNTESILAEYHREFAPITAYLIEMHCITRCKASVLYISTFPTEYRPGITTRLMIKCPDICPNDGYDLKEMNSTAQFIITSQPAIALLAATTPYTAPIAPLLPAPVPTPVPTPMPVAPMPAAQLLYLLWFHQSHIARCLSASCQVCPARQARYGTRTSATSQWRRLIYRAI